jgi:hypothetical protein
MAGFLLASPGEAVDEAQRAPAFRPYSGPMKAILRIALLALSGLAAAADEPPPPGAEITPRRRRRSRALRHPARRPCDHQPGPQAISSSEEIVVRGSASPSVETYAGPELDAWDR